MNKFLVEITIVQTVEADSKENAEIKAMKAIPKVIFDRFPIDVEVNYSGA